MSTTSRSTAAPKRQKKKQLTPVGPEMALEMLRSALVYLQLEGIQISRRDTPDGLLLRLDGIAMDGVRFVLSTPQPELPVLAMARMGIASTGKQE